MVSNLWIFGKNAVMEAVQNTERIITEKVSIKPIPGFKQKDKSWFDKKFGNESNHQGIAALISEEDLCTIEDAYASSRILILDQITDPHNLGAIIRSAAVFGFKNIIIMNRNSADINAVVYKTASGGMEYVNIIKVNNLSRSIIDLKEHNFWILGLDEKGSRELKDYSFSESTKIALVIGSEGFGIRRLVKDLCDEILYIKPCNTFSTLNASNASCIAMYQLAN